MCRNDLASAIQLPGSLAERVRNAVADDDFLEVGKLQLYPDLLHLRGFTYRELGENRGLVFQTLGQEASERCCNIVESKNNEIKDLKNTLTTWRDAFVLMVERYRGDHTDADLKEARSRVRVASTLMIEHLNVFVETTEPDCPLRIVAEGLKDFAVKISNHALTRPIAACSEYADSISQTLSELYKILCSTKYFPDPLMPTANRKSLIALTNSDNLFGAARRAVYGGLLYDLKNLIEEYPSTQNEIIQTLIRISSISKNQPILDEIISSLSIHHKGCNKSFLKCVHSVLEAEYEWSCAQQPMSHAIIHTGGISEVELNAAHHTIAEVGLPNFQGSSKDFNDLLLRLNERNKRFLKQPPVHTVIFSSSRNRSDLSVDSMLGEIHSLEMRNLKTSDGDVGLTHPTGIEKLRELYKSQNATFHAFILDGQIEGSFIQVGNERYYSQFYQDIVIKLKNEGHIPLDVQTIDGEVLVISEKLRSRLKEENRSGSTELLDEILLNVAGIILQASALEGRDYSSVYAVAYVGIENQIGQLSHQKNGWIIVKDMFVQENGSEYFVMYKPIL